MTTEELYQNLIEKGYNKLGNRYSKILLLDTYILIEVKNNIIKILASSSMGLTMEYMVVLSSVRYYTTIERIIDTMMRRIKHTEANIEFIFKEDGKE